MLPGVQASYLHGTRYKFTIFNPKLEAFRKFLVGRGYDSLHGVLSLHKLLFTTVFIHLRMNRI